MGTRSGDIDPSIMEFIAKKENLDIDGVDECAQQEVRSSRYVRRIKRLQRP